MHLPNRASFTLFLVLSAPFAALHAFAQTGHIMTGCDTGSFHTEYEGNAGAWLAAIQGMAGFDGMAFDYFYPGLVSGFGCVAPAPTATLDLAHGTVSVTKLDSVPDNCCLFDATSFAQCSDGVLWNGLAPTLALDFSPPITAFYTYYASLVQFGTVRMSLYSGSTLIGHLCRTNTTTDFISAFGHGFTSTVPVDHIEFTCYGDLTVLGTFLGLAANEQPVGSIDILGYAGPYGAQVLYDFGVVFDFGCDTGNQHTEYEGNTNAWVAAVQSEPGFEKHAFDSFFPGIQNGVGCVAPAPVATLNLAHGTMSITKLDSIPDDCCIIDGWDFAQFSDAVLWDGDAPRLAIDFSPPITAFYGFYGLFDPGATIKMDLYSCTRLIGTPCRKNLITGKSVGALGHGFVSTAPVDRIEFTAIGDHAVLGVLIYLAQGEQSLGTVDIPGYMGPNGSVVQLDFGLVFDLDTDGDGLSDSVDNCPAISNPNQEDCQGNGVGDICELVSGSSKDFNANGAPDECESLSASTDMLSTGAGGSLALMLHSGPSLAGHLYLVLGTASGTSPGLVYDGILIPLNVDGYTVFTLNNPNAPPLSQFRGFLSGSGTASASLSIPPGAVPSLAGATLHHLFLAVDLSIPKVVFASNTMPLHLTN